MPNPHQGRPRPQRGRSQAVRFEWPVSLASWLTVDAWYRIRPDGTYAWDTLLRNPADVSTAWERNSLTDDRDDAAFAATNQTLGFSSRYQNRQADIPVPGEKLRVVAINRTTGYVGSTTFTLGQTGADGTSVGQEVPMITLLPPNLKVWAKRTRKLDAGLEKDETKEYLIGNEGAATPDDQVVAIYTEWLDADGRPLPEGLGLNRGKDFGLTGRLLKLVGDSLEPVQAGTAVDSTQLDINNDPDSTADDAQQANLGGTRAADFPIAPGRHLQLVQLPDDRRTNAHFFVNVIGRAKSKEDADPCTWCNFETTGSNEGLLAKRRSLYTPFLVPRYDEAATLKLRRERNALAAQEAEQTPPPGGDTNAEALGRVEAQYAWVLRPEYQFSLIDLEVSKIEAYRLDEDGNPIPDSARDLLDDEEPVITNTDDLIRVLYSLVIPEENFLGSFEHPNEDSPEATWSSREYILALGEEEMRLTVGPGGQIDFENLAHLASLDVEDFLTVRLYLNGDDPNLLWEWAFEYLALDTQDTEIDARNSKFIPVSADEPTVDLQALLVGYYKRDPATRRPARVKWEIIEGFGTLESSEQTSEDVGSFFNTLTLPRTAGSKAKIRVSLIDDPDTYSELGPFIVLPGEPAHIEVASSGQAVQMAQGHVDLTANVYDAAFNKVADGTPVDVQPVGELRVAGEVTGTDNGTTQARVLGDLTPGDYQVRVAVGDVSEVVDVNVAPLTVEFVNPPHQVPPGSTTTVQVRVTRPDGTAAEGVPVEVAGEGLLPADRAVLTDASGHAQVPVLASPRARASILKARVGFGVAVNTPVNSESPAGSVRPVLSEHAIVGDKPAGERVPYQRYDGVGLNLPTVTATTATVDVPTGGLRVQLGHLLDPNHRPLAAFTLNELETVVTTVDGNDTAELRSPAAAGAGYAVVTGGEIVRDSRHGPFTDSLQLHGGGRVRLPLMDAAPAEPGFRLDFKALTPGVLLSYGPLQAVYQADDTVRVTLETATGTLSLTTDTVTRGAWHRFGLRVSNGQLVAQVEGRPAVTATLSGAVPWRSVRAELGIGMAGNLREFAWYDAASTPLVTFADGSISKTLTATGTQALSIVSTVSLNPDRDAIVPQHNVAIQVSNTAGTQADEQLLTLVDSSRWAEVLGAYASFAYNGSEVPPINTAGLTNPAIYGPPALIDQATGFFIQPAYALDVYDLGGGLLSAGKAFLDVMWLNDIKVIYAELNHLIDGETVNWTALAFSTASLIPAFKALRIADRIGAPLARVFAKLSAHPAAMSMLGKALLQTSKRALSERNIDVFVQWGPFLIAMVEIADSENLLNVLFGTIGNTDDVFALMTFLTLPADGWDGDGDPPAVEVTAPASLASVDAPRVVVPGNVARAIVFDNVLPDQVDHPVDQLMGMVVTNAYAASRPGRRRVDMGELKSAARKDFDNLTPAEINEIVALKGQIRAFVDGLRSASAGNLRVKAVRIGSALIRISRATGAKGLSNLIKGPRNMRVSRLTLLGTIYYLEDQGRQRKIDDETRGKLRRMYQTILADSPDGLLTEEEAQDALDELLAEGNPGRAKELTKSGHASAMQVVAAAYYQAKAIGIGQPRLKALEKERSIFIFPSDRARIDAGVPVLRLIRRIDVLLEVDSGPEKWVELKSYMGKPGRLDMPASNRVSLAPWNLGADKSGKNSSMHKQYYVDRFAMSNSGKAVVDGRPARLRNATIISVDGYRWWFQKFKRTVRPANGPGAGQVQQSVTLGKIKERFAKRPEGMTTVVKFNLLGEGRSDLQVAELTVGEMNAKALLKEALRDAGESTASELLDLVSEIDVE